MQQIKLELDKTYDEQDCLKIIQYIKRVHFMHEELDAIYSLLCQKSRETTHDNDKMLLIMGYMHMNGYVRDNGNIYITFGELNASQIIALKFYEKVINNNFELPVPVLDYVFRMNYINQNYKSTELYELILKSKNVLTINNLAHCYKYGFGVKKYINRDRMIELYNRGIELNCIESINRLAYIYRYDDKKNYTKAIELYKKASSLNNSNAIGNLASMYLLGQGVETDYQKAIKLYEKAINLGDKNYLYLLHIDTYMLLWNKRTNIYYKKIIELVEKAIELNDEYAMYVLAMMYLNGYKVKKDYNKALSLFEKAAKLNNLLAMNRLFDLYTQNENYDNIANIKWLADKYYEEKQYQDYHKAKILYEKIAKFNDPHSIKILGDIYFYGRGIDMDYRQAFKLYCRAIRLGIKDRGDCLVKLAYMYKKGEYVRVDYDKAIELYERAIKLCNDKAMVRLASMYYSGEEIEKDLVKARRLYKKATRYKNTEAMIMLADMYKDDCEYEKAIKLYIEAIDLGCIDAMINLASIYCNKYNKHTDYSKAIDLYKNAIVLGNSNQAMVGLAKIYEDQEEEKKKIKYPESEIFNLYEKAASFDNSTAMKELGWIYYLGRGVVADKKKAIHFFERAINQGNVNAMSRLASIYSRKYSDYYNYSKAINLYEKLILSGRTRYMADLAELCEKVNDSKALKLYEKSFFDDPGRNMHILSDIYRLWYENDTIINDKESEFFELILKKPMNQFSVKNCINAYETGNYFKRNFNRALKLCEKLIENSEYIYYDADFYKNKRNHLKHKIDLDYGFIFVVFGGFIKEKIKKIFISNENEELVYNRLKKTYGNDISFGFVEVTWHRKKFDDIKRKLSNNCQDDFYSDQNDDIIDTIEQICGADFEWKNKPIHKSMTIFDLNILLNIDSNLEKMTIDSWYNLKDKLERVEKISNSEERELVNKLIQIILKIMLFKYHIDELESKNRKLNSDISYLESKNRAIELENKSLRVEIELLKNKTSYYQDITYTGSLSQDPYEILGVPKYSNLKLVSSIYRQLALIYHPDKFNGFSQTFKKINQAYENIKAIHIT